MANSSLMEELVRQGSVVLEGYRHQVGGQFQLMKFGECVCKPLVLRENKFYESLSEELKTFTAVYHGEGCYRVTAMCTCAYIGTVCVCVCVCVEVIAFILD